MNAPRLSYSWCGLLAKNRLITQILIGLLTILSTILPNQAEANTLNNKAKFAVNDYYSVLHVSPETTLPVATSSAKTAVATEKKNPYKSPKEIEAVVKSYFKDTPIMAEIAKCESHYRQYTKSGDVYRGSINTSDVGVMQINEKYHLKTAKKMGIDIYSLDGNMAYAKYLYQKEGSGPWLSSGACWDNADTAEKPSNVAINNK